MRCFKSHRIVRQARVSGRHLGRNAKGAAAVEFAMIVPLLFMLLIGALEFGNAITIDRRVSQISSSVADLVSRKGEITTGELDFITDKIAKSIIYPFDEDPSVLKISVVSVKASPTDPDDTTVDWSYSHNGGPNYTSGDNYTIPTGLLTAGASVIVGEVTYDYTPLIFSAVQAEALTGAAAITTGAYTMTEKFYLSPRTKICVSYNNVDCVTGNPF